MSEKFIDALYEELGPKHYFALLISVTGLTVIAPLVDHYLWARVVVGGLVILSLLTASLVARPDGHITIKSFFLAFAAATMWTLAFTCNIAPFNTNYFGIASYAVTLAFFVTICSGMCQDVFSGRVTVNRICGAVCIYVLIGFCFAILHMMVVLADPSAYKETAMTGNPIIQEPLSAEKRYPLFVYFSFCTISTLGYGDVIPVSRLARSLSWMESLTGQLYLTVLVARLVGLHIAAGTPSSLDVSRYTASSRELEGSRK
jgi:voltage-gated potassium channel